MGARRRAWVLLAAVAGNGALAVATGDPATSQPAVHQDPPAATETTRPAVTDAQATDRVRRLPPRPALTEAEYRELAGTLRRLYGGPSSDWPKPDLDAGVEHHELGLMPAPEYPAGNPHSQEKADLGLRLFFDARLSGSGQIACASCHDPELGWADGRAVSYGHARQILKRNAPTLLNTGYATSWFWDGRAASLEDQATAVIANPAEMRGDPKAILATLRQDPVYPPLFEKAFGSTEISSERLTQALATYERTIVSEGHTGFDRFLRGEADALSDEAVRGLHLFRTTARCLNCHNGPNFTDNQFHNVGLTYYGREYEDLGRYNVTKKAEDVGRFKTPSLRNVARTSPYMHNGLFDLEGVLNMYNAGMGEQRRKAGQENDRLFPVKSPHLRSLGLNKQDLADLRAFLESLSERRRRVRVPETNP